MSLTNPSSLHSALARAMTSLLFVSVLLAGCGGGGGGSDAVTAPPPPPPATTYTIGGSLSGLTGSGLVLQNNAGDNLNVPAKATSFAFPTAIANGAAYAVTVLTQPTNPAQTCSVSSGSGTVSGANVTMVAIACTVNVYTVGGSISGLTGSGLVLQDNAGDNLNVAAKATSFTFPTAIASGAAYAVTVLTQPSNPAQTCTVSNGSGTVTGANVTKVAIACSANVYTVGGSVGALNGSGLVLQDNAGDNLSVPAKATSFTFPTAIPSGGSLCRDGVDAAVIARADMLGHQWHWHRGCHEHFQCGAELYERGEICFRGELDRRHERLTCRPSRSIRIPEPSLR